MRRDLRRIYPADIFDRKFEDCIRDKKNVVLQGGYGKNNLGDDALLLAIYNHIKEINPQSAVTVICHFPDNVRRRYGINAVGYKSRNLPAVYMRCDALIIGGGGIVNIINSYSGFQIFKMADPKGKFLFISSLVEKMLGRTVVFYGVGMTSFPDIITKRLMDKTLTKIDLMSVRDDMSYKYVKSVMEDKAYLCYDPALDYKGELEVEDKELEQLDIPSGYVAISIRSVPDDEAMSNLKDAVRHLIDHCIRDGKNILLLPVSCHPTKTLEDDRIILHEIYSTYHDNSSVKLIDEYLGPAIIQKILINADAMVMSRLHGLVITYDYDIPTIVLSYSEKVSLFARQGDYRYIYDYRCLDAQRIVQAMESLVE